MFEKELDKKYQPVMNEKLDDYLGHTICDVQDEIDDVTVPNTHEYNICGM